MKLPALYRRVLGTARRSSPCRSVLVSASCESQLPLTVPVAAGSRSRSVTCDAWCTGECLRQV